MSEFYDEMIELAGDVMETFKNPIKATLERFTTIPNGQGGNVKTWSVLNEFDIAILPSSGGDSFTTDRIESTTPVVAYANYSDISHIMADDRIVHDGKTYRLEDNFDIGKANACIKLILNDGRAA